MGMNSISTRFSGAKVYDMSYGGGAMYGPGKSYNLFAGRDASVALAKVSLRLGWCHQQNKCSSELSPVQKN